MKNKETIYIGVAIVLGICLALVALIPKSAPQCKMVKFRFDEACYNKERQQINNNEPTMDFKVTNKGQTLNGFVVNIENGEQKLFRTIKSGDIAIIQVPFEGTAHKASLTPIVIENQQVIYCMAGKELMQEGGFKPCA